MRYGEVLLAYLEGEQRVEVFNSFPLNSVLMNSGARSPQACQRSGRHVRDPQRTSLLADGRIGKVQKVDPQLRTFGGIDMRRVAMLDLKVTSFESFIQRTPRQPGSGLVLQRGKHGQRTHSPLAKTYVMQAYCTGVDESLTEASLDGLGARLQLPLGWSYGSRVLDTELVVDNTERVATVIQDELENTYTLLD